MTKITKMTVFSACVLAAGLAMAIYALFHGYFDHGQFEVKQAEWSSSRQLAMLVERSDQEALGGLTYFVLIGDHMFSPSELKHAYHSDTVVFAAANNCLTLHWEDPNKLVVACKGSSVTPDQIDVQKRQGKETAISYKNIAMK